MKAASDSDVSGPGSSTRTDYADFHLSLDDAWYGRVTLLFGMKFRHDSGEIREVECAMIDTHLRLEIALINCNIKCTKYLIKYQK